MDAIMDIAKRHRLAVVEDAAQGVMSTYKGRALGSIGDMGCFSFHETKNVISGEGGALLVNNPKFADRAEMIREKGTNRSLFFRGQVDKYTWVDQGSSYLPGEVIAAFLCAQLEAADDITQRRMVIWNRYHEAFAELESEGLLIRPVVPEGCSHNAHMYYLLLPDLEKRTRFIQSLKEHDIYSVFHYIPLHSAPAGLKYSRYHGDMSNTNDLADRLVRLPLWVGLDEHLDRVISSIKEVVKSGANS
jgi:dTDP-4-amino-4,6-dideoxygalactose transaminase